MLYTRISLRGYVMFRDKKMIFIQLLALAGLGLAIKLAFIYYAANYDRYALSSFCSINEFIDCDGVARTIFSQFLGIPLAYWGIFFYLIVLFLTVVDKFKNLKWLKFLEVFKNPKAYIAFLGLVSFLCSMVLAGISIHLIKKICILCFMTYIIDLIIAILASDLSFKNLGLSIKTTVLDFIDGFKHYPKTAIILILLFTSFITYSGVTLNFVPNVKYTKAIMKYREMKKNPYRVNGNVLGNENGNVVIELYSDFVCPLCYINNIMLHQAVHEFKNIKVIHYNYPFDRDCNSHVSRTMHPKACFMSRAAIAASKQGNYWGMSSLLYENQPQSMKAVGNLAIELNLDIDRFYADMNDLRTAEELGLDIEKAAALKIDATPTMYINGRRYVGIRPYYDLKEILIKHGAKR